MFKVKPEKNTIRIAFKFLITHTDITIGGSESGKKQTRDLIS